VIDITAEIAGQALNGCTPSNGGVHDGSPKNPQVVASAEADYVGRRQSV
jgi:hypothetical protein